MNSFQLREAIINYEKERNPEVTRYLLDTIRKHLVPTPPNTSVTARMPTELLYVKQLTKAARYLIDDTEEGTVDLTEFSWPTSTLSKEQMYLVYWFNQRGIDLIESKKYDLEELTERSVQIMYGHFFSDMADIAFHIAKKNDKLVEKLAAAVLAFKDITHCINSSEKIDPKHAVYQYGKRGEIGMFLGKNDVDTKRRIDWLEKAYNDYKEGKEATSKIDPQHSAHQLSFMGEIAKQLAELVEEVNLKTFWLEKAYKDYTEAIKKTENFNPKHAAAIRGHKAGIIKLMANTLTDTKLKCTLLERCYEEYAIAVEISEKIDLPISGYQYGHMGESARSIVIFVDDNLLKIEWLERAYNCLSKSEERIREMDKKYSGYQLNSMACVALNLANIIEGYALKKAWFEKSYNNFKESGQRLFEIDKRHTAFSWTLSGDVAKRIADIEPNPNEKIMWLEIALNDNLIGAENVREFNEEHYAMTHLNAARVASEFFKLNREHFSTAISSYTIYANYFETNVKPENINLYQRVLREIELLKEIQRNITSRKDKGNGRTHEKEYEAVYENKGLEEFQRRQKEKEKDGNTRHNRKKGAFRKLRRAGMMEK